MDPDVTVEERASNGRKKASSQRITPKLLFFCLTPWKMVKIPSSTAGEGIHRHFVEAFCCRKHSWNRFPLEENGTPETRHLHECVWRPIEAGIARAETSVRSGVNSWRRTRACSWPLSSAAKKGRLQVPLAGDSEGDVWPGLSLQEERRITGPIQPRP